MSGRQISAAGLAVGSKGKRGVLLTLLLIAVAVGGRQLLPWAYSQVTESAYSATSFTSADHLFSVMLPGEGKVEPQTRPFAGAVANAALAESRDGDALVEQLILDPEAAADFDGEAAMREMVDESAKDSSDRVSNYTMVPFGRFKGVEATVTDEKKPSEALHIRMVYTGGSVIVITCDPSVYQRTAKSLRIPSSVTPRPKPSSK